MKLSLLTLLASLAVALATRGKTYLITFPDDTPQDEVDKAADQIQTNVRCLLPRLSYWAWMAD